MRFRPPSLRTEPRMTRGPFRSQMPVRAARPRPGPQSTSPIARRRLPPSPIHRFSIGGRSGGLVMRLRLHPRGCRTRGGRRHQEEAWARTSPPWLATWSRSTAARACWIWSRRPRETWCRPRPPRRPRRSQRGMVSAEWAVGIVAAVAIAGVLLAVITGGQVQDALLKFILWVIRGLHLGCRLRDFWIRRSTMSTWPDRARDGRGMVTAELAVATLTAFTLLIMMCWGIFLLVIQLRCIDTATAVAPASRSWRSGRSGSRKGQRTSGAKVVVQRRPELVTVTVRVALRPLADWLVTVPLQAPAGGAARARRCPVVTIGRQFGGEQGSAAVPDGRRHGGGGYLQRRRHGDRRIPGGAPPGAGRRRPGGTERSGGTHQRRGRL